MTTWAIRNEHQRQQVIKVIQNREMPCTVEITKGAPRSIEQNKLQRLWINEAQEQGDQTAEEYRAYCKLAFGIPLMCEQSPEFAAQWETFKERFTYEELLSLMALPFDYPVTRKMTTGFKKKYLDRVYLHFTGMGFTMTDPKGYY